MQSVISQCREHQRVTKACLTFVLQSVRQLRLMLFRLIKSSAAALQPRGARADDYDRSRCLLAIADKNTRRKAAFFSEA